ncbi:MAG: SDR family NAD(P)-dependent oxidoreductase [Ilumatobacteraceae bacterium]
MSKHLDQPRTALVLGGNSDIALATVRRLAVDRLTHVMLAVRDVALVEARLRASPLLVATVDIVAWDARQSGEHVVLLERAATALGTIDLVLCAVGSLGHGAGIGASPHDVEDSIWANFTGPATAITAAAQHLVRQGSGSIVVLSSVAGLRARKSNYLYGAAKAGLDTFTQGLADAVAASGVRVHLIRPGFVSSKMTEGLRPAPFSTTTDVVAEAIATAVVASRSQVVHVPRPLGPLFTALKLTPRPLWRRIAGNR